MSNPNLDGATSPRTIWQSARDGVPISGGDPAPANDRIRIGKVRSDATSATFQVNASGSGTARIHLWRGEIGAIRVWTTSCSKQADPPPDYGLTPCAVSDGAIPPWSPDQSGHLVAQLSVAVHAGHQTVTVPIPEGVRVDRGLDSFETAHNEVQAFDVPLG